VHLAYIWIVSHLRAKNYRNWWTFDEVLTKTNLLSFFWDTVYTQTHISTANRPHQPNVYHLCLANHTHSLSTSNADDSTGKMILMLRRLQQKFH